MYIIRKENQNGPFNNNNQKTRLLLPKCFTQYVLHNIVPFRALHGGHSAVEAALAECHRLGVSVLRVLEKK